MSRAKLRHLRNARNRIAQSLSLTFDGHSTRTARHHLGHELLCWFLFNFPAGEP
jgi:hypothetical protein